MNNNPIYCKQAPQVRVLQSPTDVKKMTNHIVHVLSNNTTYYVDARNEVTIIASGDVYADDYNYIQNPLRLRNQSCYDFVNNRAIHYNAKGDYRLTKLEEQ